MAEEPGAPESVSANDALCALIWRCLIQARCLARPPQPADRVEAQGGGERAEESCLNMVYDGRSSYSSTLPETYLGNLTFNVISGLPQGALVGSDDATVGSVAALLRRNAGRIDSANLRSLFGLLDGLPDYDELTRLKRRRTSTVGDHDLSISSLVHVRMDGVCFGRGAVFGNGGHVEAARRLMGTINSWTRTCLVAPRLRNGGVEFAANMYDEEFEVLMADIEFF